MILGDIPRCLLLSVSLQVIGSAENSKQEGQNQMQKVNEELLKWSWPSEWQEELTLVQLTLKQARGWDCEKESLLPM